MKTTANLYNKINKLVTLKPFASETNFEKNQKSLNYIAIRRDLGFCCVEFTVQ